MKSIMEGSLSNAGTNVLNNVVDMQLAGELSNLSLRYGEYRAEGLTDEEARQRLLDESVKAIVTDLITGGLTAGIFSGVGNLYSKVQGGSPDIDVVKPIDGDGNTLPNSLADGKIGDKDTAKIDVEDNHNEWDNIFKDGTHYEDGKLKPNIVYKAGEHDYLYMTNGDGLIVRAKTDNLQFKIHVGRLDHNPNTYGKESGDHAGHIFGDRFGGSPELDNLVSQARKVNLSDYKLIENQWAKSYGRY